MAAIFPLILKLSVIQLPASIPGRKMSVFGRALGAYQSLRTWSGLTDQLPRQSAEERPNCLRDASYR